jgi:hypothetical protein
LNVKEEEEEKKLGAIGIRTRDLRHKKSHTIPQHHGDMHANMPQ